MTPSLLFFKGLVDADETIIGLACGDGQTMAVSTAGNVWGWGCYIDKEGKKFFNPSKSGTPHKISYIFLNIFTFLIDQVDPDVTIEDV